VCINNICFSTDKRHVEAWNNGNRCTTAAVSVSGLEAAFQWCRNYLLSWSGIEPRVDRELKAELAIYPGCDPDRRCVHGNLWGGACEYCDGFNNPV
jgi:hypothetical protein